jgi:hypothetical protein
MGKAARGPPFPLILVFTNGAPDGGPHPTQSSSAFSSSVLLNEVDRVLQEPIRPSKRTSVADICTLNLTVARNSP